MGEPYLTVGKGGVYLSVHAQPGARQPSLRGLHGEAVKIAVKEAAEAGKANKAIEAFIAKALGIPKSSVSVTSGHTSRAKRIFIDGDADSLSQKIREWLESC